MDYTFRRTFLWLTVLLFRVYEGPSCIIFNIAFRSCAPTRIEFYSCPRSTTYYAAASTRRRSLRTTAPAAFTPAHHHCCRCHHLPPLPFLTAPRLPAASASSAFSRFALVFTAPHHIPALPSSASPARYFLPLLFTARHLAPFLFLPAMPGTWRTAVLPLPAAQARAAFAGAPAALPCLPRAAGGISRAPDWPHDLHLPFYPLPHYLACPTPRGLQHTRTFAYNTVELYCEPHTRAATAQRGTCDTAFCVPYWTRQTCLDAPVPLLLLRALLFRVCKLLRRAVALLQRLPHSHVPVLSYYLSGWFFC